MGKWKSSFSHHLGYMRETPVLLKSDNIHCFTLCQAHSLALPVSMYFFFPATIGGRHYCFPNLQMRKMTLQRLHSLLEIPELIHSCTAIRWESVPPLPYSSTHALSCLLTVCCKNQNKYFMKKCYNAFHFQTWYKEFWVYFKKCKKSLNWALLSSLPAPTSPSPLAERKPVATTDASFSPLPPGLAVAVFRGDIFLSVLHSEPGELALGRSPKLFVQWCLKCKIPVSARNDLKSRKQTLVLLSKQLRGWQTP